MRALKLQNLINCAEEICKMEEIQPVLEGLITMGVALIGLVVITILIAYLTK